jgi:ribonucleoside-diphosphate reductase alpha chain
VGIEERPQCSACFINSVEDTMGSILDLAKTEGLLFKYGSGAGSNLSSIRSSKEKLSSGGEASGPVSFMKGFDAFAGVIKSGGKTRRAAKMVILNIDHPDIIDFIECKESEEKKAWALIEAGYDGSFGGEAYNSIFFQNSNNSIRVSDEFMEAYQREAKWYTRAVTTGEVLESHDATDLMNRMAHAAHTCGDPGIQYDTTIQKWHTCSDSGRINATNPCAEYVFLDDTACNLGSMNLMKFRRPDGSFDVDQFRHAVRIMFTAMEIIVGNASYPTPKIELNSHTFRPLGLGFANLGALLMAWGIPYDSDRGREMAAAVTAILCGEAYSQSARMADHMGPFDAFEKNRTTMLRVMEQHRDAALDLDQSQIPSELYDTANACWKKAIELGEIHGYRNAQAVVIAPTGTIGFMMDCDTTGIEPDLALVKFKNLVGGGFLKIVNNTVAEALVHLGYAHEDRNEILQYISDNGTIEGAPQLEEKHLNIFDCALPPIQGVRSIHHMGHVKMMAAVQPFVSGAISKTVNMPSDTTPEEIREVYEKAWKLGLKCMAVYRDGCKRSQPLMTGNTDSKSDSKSLPLPSRRHLPDERQAITHKFSIGGHEGYLTVGMYEDGSPGEIFIVMAKEGSVVSGLMDGVATTCSISLQYGVPLQALVNKFKHTRFEPSGITSNSEIPLAKSILDYIFRWMERKFLTSDFPPVPAPESKNSDSEPEEEETPMRTLRDTERYVFRTQSDAPACADCGAIMVRNGACYKCLECGSGGTCD